MRAAERLEELLSLDRVRHMTGMGTTFIYGEIKAGRFPRSIRIADAHPGYNPRCKAGFGSRSPRTDRCRWMGSWAGRRS